MTGARASGAERRAAIAARFVGRRVRFAPWPGRPDRVVEARVIRVRESRHFVGSQRNNVRDGWLDTEGDDGVVRSVLPARCTIVEGDHV